MSMKEYLCMLDTVDEDTVDEEPVRVLAPDILDAAETYKQILFARGYTENEIKLHQIIKEVRK